MTDRDSTARPTSDDTSTSPLWFGIKGAIREFSRDQCTDLAAALTYYATLSLFPAVVALVSLVGIVGDGRSTTRVITRMLDDLGQAELAAAIEGPLTSLAQTPVAGTAFALGLVGALWSASAYVGAFGRAMNRIYEVREGRPFWKLRPLMLLVTLVCVVVAALTVVGLVISGPIAEAIGSTLGMGEQAVAVWGIARWPAILVMVVIAVALLYWATPNVQQPSFRLVSAGAVIAIGVWVLASFGFAFYVSHFSNYDRTYGSLAGVIVFLLWLWLTNLALLFGAEVDAEVERARELLSGIPAEERLHLPPRDTTGTTRVKDKYADLVTTRKRVRVAAAEAGAHAPSALDAVADRVGLEPLPSELGRRHGDA